MQHLTRGSSNGLLRQVNSQPIVFLCLGLSKKPLHRLFRQRDRQNTVIEAVIIKDVGETRGNDGAETILTDCPRSVLTRGATAKVIASQQNAYSLILRLIQ